jgi:hypothetical protein
MEGNTLQTDMKQSDKEDISRLPVFITSNNDLWMWTEECEREPLQQRYVQFNLTKKIKSIVLLILTMLHLKLPQMISICFL